MDTGSIPVYSTLTGARRIQGTRLFFFQTAGFPLSLEKGSKNPKPGGRATFFSGEVAHLEIALRLPALVFFCDVLPLVIQLLALCEGNLHFHEAPLEID